MLTFSGVQLHPKQHLDLNLHLPLGLCHLDHKDLSMDPFIKVQQGQLQLLHQSEVARKQRKAPREEARKLPRARMAHL